MIGDRAHFAQLDNALQAKVLSNLQRTRPDVRTLTIDWTAWGGIGMATRGSIPKIMAAAARPTVPKKNSPPFPLPHPG